MALRRITHTVLLATCGSLMLVHPATAQSSWSRVQALNPGAHIVISRDDIPGLTERVFVFADADVLVVLNLSGLNLNDRDVASLVAAADRFMRPSPVRTVEAVTFDTARIAPDGVWIGTRRLGDVNQRIERIQRPVIALVRTRGRIVGSKTGATIGAIGGGVLGYIAAVRFAETNGCGNCASEKLGMWSFMIGTPIATGWLGYNSSKKRTFDVIYRR